MWKCAEELGNARAKINRQAQDCAELDDNRVHLPVSIAKVDVKQGLRNSQVRRRTHREKFCNTLYDTEHNGKQEVVQSSSWLRVSQKAVRP
jgi:hypothetical protein